MFYNYNIDNIIYIDTKNKINRRKYENFKKQFECIPSFWQKRFISDNWQIVVTDKMVEKNGELFWQCFVNNKQKKIWINIGIPSLIENEIFKAIACYVYMEYGNIGKSNTFVQILKKEENAINQFMKFRGIVEYEGVQVFVEMFSFIIETNGNYSNKKLFYIYNYMKKWVNGEIFNLQYFEIPNYIEIGEDVVNEQIEEIKIAFLMLPNKLQQKFKIDNWKINISNKDLSNKKFLSGLCSSYDKKIFIKSSTPDIKKVTWHEFGHYLDFIENFPSNSILFQIDFYAEKNNLRKIYDNEENYNYAISSTAEYFAEIFANYINDSMVIRTIVPKSVKELEKIIKKWK